jgi:hypothetical protein
MRPISSTANFQRISLPLLAVTAAATVAISLRHGPLVAALGLTGAYAVPALIASDTPHALPLFAYLTFVTAGVLAVLRHRAWWWLAGPTLAGAFAWVMIWLGFQPEHPETPVVGIYILGQLALFAALRRGVPRIGFLAGISEAPVVPAMVRLAFALFALAPSYWYMSMASATPALRPALPLPPFMLGFAYRDRQLTTSSRRLRFYSWRPRRPELAAGGGPDRLLAMLRLPLEVGDFLTVCAIVAALLGAADFRTGCGRSDLAAGRHSGGVAVWCLSSPTGACTLKGSISAGAALLCFSPDSM